MRYFYTERQRLSYRPIVVQNFLDLYFLANTYEDKIYLLWYFSKLFHSWLDENEIALNSDNVKTCVVLYRVMHRICDWSKLQKNGSILDTIIVLDRRLRGYL